MFNVKPQKYTCTKCYTVCVIMSDAAELSAKCCDGDKPTKHVLGVVKKPAAVPTPVAAKK